MSRRGDQGGQTRLDPRAEERPIALASGLVSEGGHMDGSQFDALHRRLVTGRRFIVGGALAALGVAAAPSFVTARGNNKGKKCRKKNQSNPGTGTCCPPGQVPFGGGCCPPNNICNNYLGQPVCCPNGCLVGVCCPCGSINSCQQCVVDAGLNPPQAFCETYCPPGQGCLPS